MRPAREHRLLLRFEELEGLRWRITLENGPTVRVDIREVPMLLGMAPFTGISVGYDYGGPVDWALYERYRSNRLSGGTIERVRYVPGAKADFDRTILHTIEREAPRVAD